MFNLARPSAAFLHALRPLAGGAFLLCVAAFALTTLGWPLTGDASLMRYVCFLGEHGMVPYQGIQDMNLPGSYLPNWVIQHLFGASDLAWRLYDFGLLTLISFSFYRIARPYSRFAALWASCLFVLIHGRDGIDDIGQRDLCAAALVIAGTAALLAARRSNRVAPAFLFGLASGSALTIKPTMIFFLTLPLLDLILSRVARKPSLRRFLAALAGYITPIIICTAWLLQWSNLRSFAYTLLVLAPYHASLGHAPWRVLLYGGFSPMLPLALVGLVIWLFTRTRPISSALPTRPDRATAALLFCGAVAGWLSFILQRRAYPYQRYPFMVFLLLILALQLDAALRRTDRIHWLSAAALLWTSLLFAPSSLWKAAHYQSPEEAFDTQLCLDLNTLDRQQHLGTLSGHVQCLDTISGCIDTLDHLRWIQPTGQMYDEFLFHPADSVAVRNSRAAFLSQLQLHPPLIFVVSDRLFPSGPNGYRKLDSWPAFHTWLDANYAIVVERTPTRAWRSMGRLVIPDGYRLYLHRPGRTG
jgi:hypothetical protein